MITTGGSFSEAQVTLSGQAQKAIFKLNKYLFKFKDIPLKHYLDLFDKLVSPILNYGSEVWGFCKADRIEKVHVQYCKRLLHVKLSTQTDLILGELGRLPLQFNRFTRIVKYWLKLTQCKDTRYTKITYTTLVNDNERMPRKSNWASLVKDMLSELGFYEVWLYQGVGNIPYFVSVFKQRLRDNILQNWQARLENSPKARFYRLFSDFGFKAYLNIVTVNKFRIALSKLRLSSHTLEIEKGRYKKPTPVPVNERKCTNCNVLEDEFHLLFECSKYVQLRRKYIRKYFWQRPNIPKLVELLTSENKKDVRNLAMYTYKAFQVKSESG